MPFTLCVTRTVNGRERTLRWNLPDPDRSQMAEVVDAFTAGRLPMEGTFTISGGGAGRENPAWSRSWRWCDIKAMSIEEG